MQRFLSHSRCAPADRLLCAGDETVTELLGRIIARAGFGLVAVKPDRTVIYANESAKALMQARHYLHCDWGRISTTDFEASRKLQSLILAASRQLDVLGNGEPIVVRDGDGVDALIIHVVPASPAASSALCNLGNQSVGLLIVESQRGTAGRIDMFAENFNLTSAEARVLAELVSGGGVTRAAARLNIAASTVQTHLKHILEKTGTHRQAELVRVFYDVTIPSHRQLSPEDKSRTGFKTSLAVKGRRKIEEQDRIQFS
jgi:DNA-binding CsgD family transcriptional regulator